MMLSLDNLSLFDLICFFFPACSLRDEDFTEAMVLIYNHFGLYLYVMFCFNVASLLNPKPKEA